MRTWLSRFLSERARVFVLSLLIAVALWFYVGGTGRPPDDAALTASLRLANVEVMFSGLPDDWMASANPSQVDVELRWPAASVLAVRTTDVRAIADLAGLEPGPHPVALRIEFPAGVTTARVVPPSVVVTLVRP
jgi:YbbR domain-containing protein